MSRFILRFDDVCPTMDWARFAPFEALCQRHPSIRPLVGVVPDNRDPMLKVGPPCADYWGRVRRWRDAGWTIAQHGHQHLYLTRSAGVLGLGGESEFAGLPYEQQRAKLAEGQEILRREGVWQPCFMAPAHSFDRQTLAALRVLGFESLTDGWGLYPYRLGGLVAVPQLFASPLHFGVGIYTICLHTNTMSDSSLAAVVRFAERHASRFIGFEEALNRARGGLGATLARMATRTLVRSARAARGAIQRRR